MPKKLTGFIPASQPPLIISLADRGRSSFDSPQHEIDAPWFASNPDRRLRARWATNKEFMEGQLPQVRGSGWRPLAIVARCGCCNCHHIRTIWSSAERVELWLSMSDDELLAEVIDEDRYFFQRITSKPLPEARRQNHSHVTADDFTL